MYCMQVGYLRRVGVLCMRLTRHIVRENNSAKSDVMEHLHKLIELLDCDVHAADT